MAIHSKHSLRRKTNPRHKKTPRETLLSFFSRSVEKAVCVYSGAHEPAIHTPCDRVYFGVEFCQRLMPPPDTVMRMHDKTFRQKKSFTLVTPFVTDEGLRRLKMIFAQLKRRKIRCEVVVNDWGVLGYLNREYHSYFDIVLGRLLTRQHRVPMKKSFLTKQFYIAGGSKNKITVDSGRSEPTEYVENSKRSFINTSSGQKILTRLHVRRLEMNNVFQSIRLDGIRLPVSLYVPYVHVATTRFCPYVTPQEKIYRISSCRKQCVSHRDILQNEDLAFPLIRKGNSLFYVHQLDLEGITDEDVKKIIHGPADRLVMQKEIPS